MKHEVKDKDTYDADREAAERRGQSPRLRYQGAVGTRFFGDTTDRDTTAEMNSVPENVTDPADDAQAQPFEKLASVIRTMKLRDLNLFTDGMRIL